MNLELLLKLRVVVARYGEMDGAKWWNTRGQLGRLGAAALRRGFPRTHWFAQARSVFAVADHRCCEVFDPPGSVTLWRLTPEIEEEFDAKWETWLDEAPQWTAFFEALPAGTTTDLVNALAGADLIGPTEQELLTRLRRSADGRGVLLPGVFERTDSDIRLLATAFARGEVASLAVPYARLGES